MQITGFKNISLLAGEKGFNLFRAFNSVSGEPCLLRISSIPASYEKAKSLLRREFGITSESFISPIIKAREILEFPGSISLVLDNFEGMPIDFFPAFHKDLKVTLGSAVIYANALKDIHENGMIHRNINDNSFYVSDSIDRKVCVTGFGFSKANDYEETNAPDIRDYLDFASLEYIAPEMTGMIKIETDQRADLYSLGILFYKMLTGSVPFTSGDSLEMMHWHVAKKARPPREVNGSIPGVLSDIVMILLEKDPSDRYDNCLSLLYDLENCHKRIETNGSIHGYTPGNKIAERKVKFTDELYGRDTEKGELLSLLNSAASGTPAATFISGAPGIGKTALAKVVKQNAAERGGLFVSGKFDQYIRGIPYAALVEAGRSIIRNLLLKRDDELEAIGKRIVKSLNPNTQLMIDIAPELEHVTGKQPPAPPTDPENAENRFKRCLGDLFGILADIYKPLVVFLDDIQWVDPSGLDMIRYFLEVSPVNGLYTILAYRDNEVNNDHILARMMDELAKESKVFHVLNLGPLKIDSTENIIREALNDDFAGIKDLASLIYKKTAGNPFFVRRFLLALINSKRLAFDTSGKWTCDKSVVDSMPATENVVEMLTERINHIPPKEKNLLIAASCIGNRFDPEFLEMIVETNRNRIPGQLKRLVQGDYLIKENDSCYAFVHDKVQEAAYGLLAEDERLMLHWKIGTMLLKIHPDTEGNSIFGIVDHLNKSVKIVERKGSLKKLLELNIKAGTQAKSSVAYDAALKYFEKALSIFDELKDNNDPCMSFNIRKNYAECLYLSGKFGPAETAIYKAMEYTDSSLDLADLYNILIIMKVIDREYDEALEFGIKALDLLGVTIEKTPEGREKQLLEIKKILSGYLKDITVNEILNLPECKKDNVKRAQIILKNAGGGAFHLAEINYCQLLISKAIILSFENGLSRESCSNLSGYAFLLSTYFDEYRMANILGEAAWILSNGYSDLSEICNVSVQYANLVLIFKRHARESQRINKTGLEAGLKAGNLLFISYSVSHSVMINFFLGVNLVNLFEMLEKGLYYLIKMKDNLMADMVKALKIVVLNLSGKTEEKFLFNTQETTEEEFLNSLYKRKAFMALGVFYWAKITVLFIYGDYKGSLYYYKILCAFDRYIVGAYYAVDYYFYYSLNICALYTLASLEEQQFYRDELSNQRKKFNLWSDLCPENFLHRHLLVEAEAARIDGDLIKAMPLYDRAINSARENEYIQIEGIACERAGIFWLEMGKKDFAALYLKRAYSCFSEWGAVRKLECMREQYPDIFSEYKPELEGLSGSDLLAILKAFNVLSSHVDLVDLLKELTKIALHHSGADLFALLIEDKGDMLVQAFGTADTGKIETMQSLRLSETGAGAQVELPLEIIRYVRRTGEEITEYDGSAENMFYGIPYIKDKRPLSVMCIKTETERGAIIWYLENRLVKGVFTNMKKTVLKLLANQAAICIQNVLYHREQKNAIREIGYSFRLNGELKIISYEKIIFLSSKGRHTIIHTTEGEFDTPLLIKNVEKELPGDLFARIHKQYLVNLRYISRLKRNAGERYVLIMNDEDDSRLPVGRAFHPVIKQKLRLQAGNKIQ